MIWGVGEWEKGGEKEGERGRLHDCITG